MKEYRSLRRPPDAKSERVQQLSSNSSPFGVTGSNMATAGCDKRKCHTNKTLSQAKRRNIPGHGGERDGKR
jgi:hypothetical protein